MTPVMCHYRAIGASFQVNFEFFSFLPLFLYACSQAVDKPFHCNVCDGTFSRYSSLWSHKRLHSGDKPFKCTICGLAFAKAAYLKNHGRVHTGKDLVLNSVDTE